MSITISRNPLLLIAVCLILLICIANASDYSIPASDYFRVIHTTLVEQSTPSPLALAVAGPVISERNLDNRNVLPNSDINNRNTSGKLASEGGISGKGPISNVTIIKAVEHGCRGPRILITIKAPEINSIDNEIVIALDTSGSFGKGGRPDQGMVLREVMPDVLRYIEDINPNCSISLMSWDNDIDFVSGNQIINDLPTAMMLREAALVPIKVARAEILKQNIFDPPIHEVVVPLLNWHINLTPLKNSFSLPPWTFANGDNDTYIHFRENESTDLNVGILSALEILNKSGGDNTKSKKILLITGKSEFIPLNETVKSKIIESKYGIYVVGIGVPYGSQMNDTLTWIAARSQAYEKPYYSPGIAGWTEKSILSAIHKAIENMNKNNRIVSNISINESLYPYLRITSVTLDKNQSFVKYTEKNGTMLDINLPEGINASEKLEIIIDTELNMSLPIEVSGKRRAVHYSIDQSVGPSCVTYYWQDRNKFVVELPEKRII